MALFSAGQRLTAAALNAAIGEEKTSTQNTSGTTTSTTFTATLTGGTACSTTFVVPTSGKVMVVNTGQVQTNNAASTALMAFEIRAGSTIGSGTVLHAASDDEAVNTLGTSADRKTVATVIPSLTPGATCNIRQVFRVNSNTGTFLRKELTVLPVP